MDALLRASQQEQSRVGDIGNEYTDHKISDAC